MPSKDHRIAARHAKLRQRRKKQTKEPVRESHESPAMSLAHESSTVVALKEQAAPSRDQSGAVPTVYHYVNAEVKRIVVLASSIVAILVVAGISLT